MVCLKKSLLIQFFDCEAGRTLDVSNAVTIWCPPLIAFESLKRLQCPHGDECSGCRKALTHSILPLVDIDVDATSEPDVDAPSEPSAIPTLSLSAACCQQ